ncbi:type I polyketide synthase [Crocosphaera chwakensis]|uniref:Beta-ketoacyl synthase n=1 Tax=Crocosphaera chwakensis CCY0110 TaxID=391612 RepID=A3INX6_9CHRO|nr:type I polyketide synthase [Crocosphaera chwakensis]EAZ91778.1 Beta-ketoacyl synthase [Crocosphaera chwakensis CCY0110]
MVRDQQRQEIAIIGVGCRFPGAKNSEEFWQLLKTGQDVISEVPLQRWNIEKYYHQNPEIPGRMNTRWGGFLSNIDQFDAHFFGISPRECQHIDPQQRLMLEVAWEALEDGGIIPETLSGTQTGVFLGLTNQDYQRLLYQHIDHCDAYYSTGTSGAIASNRLSYLLNLQGPSFTVDTACSSSLVAVHLACQSLKQQESDLAIAGAVNLIITPEQTVAFSKTRMMAPDGRCKTFDSSANGYVRSEGCGIVVLKRLEDAMQDGDRIHGIIRGTAINQDGLSQGLTAPNGLAQQQVIRQALANAGVKPSEISYVETHGTGTALGDPIEVRSLKKVLMEGRNPDQTCWLGSVKTNIGHLESAAGMAGLIKTILCLQKREIPPVLHFKELNPYISLKNSTFSIPTTCEPWSVEGSRIAGVSSFSFGGTNGHVIVEEVSVLESREQGKGSGENYFERLLHLLTLSTKTEKGLGHLVQDYCTYLQSHQDLSLGNICFSANTGRSRRDPLGGAPFQYRLAIVSESTEGLTQQLQGLIRGEMVTGCFGGQVTEENDPKIVFLFTGQGSQYVNMGRELYESCSFFRNIIDECNEILKAYLDKDLVNILYKEIGNSLLDQTIYTQPALFSIEYALAKLWQFWGVDPTVVMGHSVGEYVAACIAGVFSLKDGLKLIAARGRLMQSLPQNGSMVAVLATLEKIEPMINSYQDKVAIAAINGSNSLVISGEKEAINSIIKNLDEQNIKTKQLTVSHAFHSPLMQPILAEFKELAQEISYQLPQISIISNVTGKPITEEIAKADYWVNHIISPVNFKDSVETLLEGDYNTFLEIGAKPILLGMSRGIVENKNQSICYLPSLRPSNSNWQQMLESLAKLSIQGYEINWYHFDQDYQRHRVSIPTYPWQRSRYWFEGVSQSSNSSLPTPLSQTEYNYSSEVSLLNNRKQIDSSQLMSQLKNSFKNEQLSLIIDYIQEQVAIILGLDKSQAPGKRVGFFQMGMDSLMAVEFRNRLERTFGFAMSTSLAFNYPNIEALSGYLLERLNHRWKKEKGRRQEAEGRSLELEKIARKIESYSDEDVEKMIIEKIYNILT